MEELGINSTNIMTWTDPGDELFDGSSPTTEMPAAVFIPPRRPPLSASLLKKLELIQLGQDIHKYAIPPIFILGLLGNFFSILIMRRPFMQRSSASVYFISLAVADSVALVYHLAKHWINYFPGIKHYDNNSDILCKFVMTFFLYGLQCPAWLVVAMSAERCVITSFPLKGKLWCTRRNAIIIVSSVYIVLFLYNFIQIVAHGVGPGKCDQSEYWVYAVKYGLWAALVLYTLLPTPLLILCNGIMIYKLLKARRKREIIATSADSKKSNQAISRATVAAVLVSVTYFFLTLPSGVMNAITVMTDLDKKYLELLFVHNIALVMRNINNACNFFLYLYSYPRIRAEFITMVTVCCPQRSKDRTLGVELASRATDVSSFGDSVKEHPDPSRKNGEKVSKF